MTRLVLALTFLGGALVGPACGTRSGLTPNPLATELGLEARGDREGARTLVLVHGNFDSRATWDRLTPLLEPTFRVVTLDLPGFGAAPNTRGAYGVEALAEVLADAVTASGVARAVFVGNSLGGAVVAALAAAHPDRVEGLVIEDGNLLPAQPTSEMSRALSRALTVAPADQASLRVALEPALRLALPTPGAVDAALVARFAAGLDAAHRPELDRQRAAFTLDGLHDRLVAARATRPFPVLVVWGVDDPLVPLSAAERLLPRLRGARAAFFAGAGHAPHLERPRELADLLVRAFGGKEVSLPSEDVLVPSADGRPLAPIPLEHPRLHAARARALGRSGPAGAPSPTATPATGPALEATCAAGALGDCFHLARLVLVEGYARRADGVFDHDRGYALLERACLGDVAIACTMLGGWNRGLGPVTAARLFARGCDLGHAEGCFESARAIDAGRGVMPDPDAAERRYDRACALGFADGCKERDAIRARPERDRAWLAAHEAACRGSGPSKDIREELTCQVVADAYLEGRGTRPDPARAVAILRRDCDPTTVTGGTCGDLAPLLAEGRGTPRDVEAALRIDRALCERDQLGHCLRLGLAIVESDRPEAERLFARATQVSDHAFTLARALRLGRPGLPPDPARADSLLRVACAGGKGEACVMLEER